MRQSFLMNERIYLRAVEPEDMDIMYEMENDPSMWTSVTLRFHTPVTCCANILKVHSVMCLRISNYV